MEDQVVYDTKQVAKQFDIATSTVRKYCDFLEKAGYSFHKNEHGHRGFFDDDLIAMRKLIEYKGAMALEDATKAVVAWKKGSDIATPAIQKERYSAQHSEEILSAVQGLTEKVQELQNEVIAQREYIHNSLEKRDQQITTFLNETMETRKQLASSGDKKRWWQIWK